MPGPNFIDDIKSTLKCAAITLILHTVGLWLIKFNFMLLFYRLGYQIQSYRVLWWVAIVLVTSCGAVTIGLIPYNCLFGSVTRLTVECATTGSVKNIYTHYIATVVIDIFSDLISKYFWIARNNLLPHLLTLSHNSHRFPHLDHLEDRTELAPETHAVKYIPACRIHYLCNRCSRHRLWWSLQSCQ